MFFQRCLILAKEGSLRRSPSQAAITIILPEIVLACYTENGSSGGIETAAFVNKIETLSKKGIFAFRLLLFVGLFFVISGRLLAQPAAIIHYSVGHRGAICGQWIRICAQSQEALYVCENNSAHIKIWSVLVAGPCRRCLLPCFQYDNRS